MKEIRVIKKGYISSLCSVKKIGGKKKLKKINNKYLFSLEKVGDVYFDDYKK